MLLRGTTRSLIRLKTALLGFSAVCALTLLAGSTANAQVSIVSTGLDASDTLIASGNTPDAHWTVDEQAGGTGAAIVTDPSQPNWFGGWLSNGTSSDWIARTSTDTANGPAPYTFYRTFDLTGYDPTSAEVVGSWAIDDGGFLALNGNTISSVSTGNWGSLTNFFADDTGSIFLPGVNTLTITITDSDNFLEAVRLQGAVFANQSVPNGTPEPGAFAFAAVLASSAGAFAIRRKRLSK